MATSPAPPAADDHAIGTVERAPFFLLKPIKSALNGSEIDLHGVEMRALATADLPLLDQYRGQTIALLQNVIAALCDLTVDQVRQLDLEDFLELATDALWMIQQACTSMGLPDDHFLRSPAAEISE